MTSDIFVSPGASLVLIAVQSLFAWALWSLRRAFVRNDEYLLHLRRSTRREAVVDRRLNQLEEQLRQLPDNAQLQELRGELGDLRGEIRALNMRISGLDRLLDRLERGLDRQEERLRPLPGTLCTAAEPTAPRAGGLRP